MNSVKTFLSITTISILLLISIYGCSSQPKYISKNYHDGNFKNQYIDYGLSFGTMWSVMIDFINDETPNKMPDENYTFPIVELTQEDIINFQNNSAVRFGHSTLLFKVDNRLVMSNPVFSERASPVSFMGPKRFHKPPIAVKDLPFIDIIIISHNHYDHMDTYTLELLKDNFGHMYVPLGIKEAMVDIGIDETKVTELDWWDEVKNKTLTLTCTPAQHFSGRGLFDGDETLWASWVINSSSANIYFSGDGGYFKGFKEIGDKKGPFDMTFMENGAYNEKWREIHMLPKDTIQAHIDLKGKILFPIHNGTFELALHSWTDPFEKILKEAQKRDVKVVQPKIGEVIPILKFTQTKRWWK